MPDLTDIHPGLASRPASTGVRRSFARVGCRLAPERPGRIDRLALLDLGPTAEVWRTREEGRSASPHRPRPARPAPGKEVGCGFDACSGKLLAEWADAGGLSSFAAEALAHHRAGAMPDVADEAADGRSGHSTAEECSAALSALLSFL